MGRYPQRVVCLTEETTETLYALGLDDRIVGISGFTMRPPHARKKTEGVHVSRCKFRRDPRPEAGCRLRLERLAGGHLGGAYPTRRQTWSASTNGLSRVFWI